jgi:hypothetical protein
VPAWKKVAVTFWAVLSPLSLKDGSGAVDGSLRTDQV